MDACNVPDLFQGEISELLERFDTVYAYINGIIVIAKKDFTDNVKALKNSYINAQKRDKK